MSDDKWIAALRRAAHPAAVTVELNWAFEPGESRYTLKSRGDAGQPLAEERDYDLLKAVMTPLENLAEASGASHGGVRLTLESDELTKSLSDQPKST